MIILVLLEKKARIFNLMKNFDFEISFFATLQNFAMDKSIVLSVQCSSRYDNND